MPWQVRRVAFAIALLLAGVCGGAAQDLTEEQVLQRFLAQSPQSRELRARIAVVEAETRARSLHPNPTAAYSREGAGFTEFFQFEQPLVLSGRLSSLRQASSAAVRAAELSARYELWDLKNEVRLAFYRLLAAQERRKILEASAAELQEVLAILQQREREGEGSKFDRLRGERELLESRMELAATAIQIAQARGGLAAFFPIGSNLATVRAVAVFPRFQPLPPQDELVGKALASRGDYLAERTQSERYLQEGMAARRLRVPEPTFFAGLKRAEALNRNRYGPVIGFSIPIPLFNRGQAEVARAAAEHERTQARLQILEQLIRAQVSAAYSVLAERRAMVEQYQRELEQRGPELVRIARLAYQEGESGILELLDVYRLSRQAQLRGMELLALTQEAHIELERVVGEGVRP